jgi:hypothetical protein
MQANPPNIEYNLWMCSEFRHPALMKGEEAFCLAQFQSAVEFCRTARCSSFDISAATYSGSMMRYSKTLKLLIACSRGDDAAVRLLLDEGADVNGLSPDNQDTPMTACVRFNQADTLDLLLNRPDAMVDALVNLFSGPSQRSTALIVAAQRNGLRMVISLLRAGANRYHQNDDDRLVEDELN